MGITLYRSGGLTPLSEVSSPDSELFDIRAVKATGVNPDRSASIYASFTLRAVDENWVTYRLDKGEDSTIHRIVVPSCFLNAIYAYNVSIYDEYSIAAILEDPENSEELIMDYIATRINLEAWEETASHLTAEEIENYEILIPHHIAAQSEWSVVSDEEIIAERV